MTPETWLEQSLKTLEETGQPFASVHLGEGCDGDGSWQNGVDSLAECGRRLPREWDGHLSLALPLRWTRRLQTRPPRAPERRIRRTEPVGEEYRRAIQAPTGLPESLPCEFVSGYYNGEDTFVNTIWIHWSPENSS